jgi:hypothetical protein
METGNLDLLDDGILEVPAPGLKYCGTLQPDGVFLACLALIFIRIWNTHCNVHCVFLCINSRIVYTVDLSTGCGDMV